LQTQRRRVREAQHDGLAPRRHQPVLGRLAHDRSAEGIGHDQPGVAGKYLARHIDDGGEEQPVAMQFVVHPLLVGAEIGHRRLDLDNQDFAVAAERDEIGAPAGRQRQFAHHRIAERMQKPRGAARYGERGRRLPAIDRRSRRQQIDAHRQDSRKRQVRPRPHFDLTHVTNSDCATDSISLVILPCRRAPEKPLPARRAKPRSRRAR
jgi:hypothetical protein